MSQVADDLPTALLEASKAVGRDDIICVIGSYYLAGEAKQWLADRRGQGSGSHPVLTQTA